MKLLVNLSFSVEGQSMILKVPGTCGVEAFWVLNVVMLGSLDFLMGMYGNGSGAEQIECLLVLRNLCFHQQSKTILSTTGEMMCICRWMGVVGVTGKWITMCQLSFAPHKWWLWEVQMHHSLLARLTAMSFTEMVATLFSCALGSGDSQQLTLAASGIGALLFNCSKVRIQCLLPPHSHIHIWANPSTTYQVRGSLKRSGLDKRLEQANLSYKATGENYRKVVAGFLNSLLCMTGFKDNPQLSHSLSTALNLLQ